MRWCAPRDSSRRRAHWMTASATSSMYDSSRADKITLQVARYRPERETEPTFQEYEVPCPPEWVVLDGLNYVKNHVDGTISHSSRVEGLPVTITRWPPAERVYGN